MDNLSIFDFIYEDYKIKKPIRLIELFAGIGSQAKALERLKANFEHYKVIEFDKYAIKSYNAVHNTNFETSDITKINASDLEIVDTDKYEYIMTYSFPCQDLSLAGKQKGMSKGSGTRSGLLWEVERLLDECNELPQVLLMENVPQVIGKKNIGDFQKWQLKLELLGYSNFVKILNSKDYGIPQNRKRCFMLSILGKYNYNFPKSFKLILRLKDMLENKVDEKYYLTDKMIQYITSDNEKFTGNNDKSLVNKSVASTINTGEGSRRCDASNYIIDNTKKEDIDLKEMIRNPRVDVAFNLYEMGISGFNRDTGEIMFDSGLCKTIQTMQGGNRQPKILVKEATIKGFKEAYDGDGIYLNRPHQKRGVVQSGMIQTLKTSGNDVGVVIDEPLCIGQVSTRNSQAGKVYSTDGVSQTLCAGTHGYAMGNIEHNLRIRKLTPRECWRLMGFDDTDYNKASKVNSDTQLYKQAGNSIVVDVLYYIFKQLLKD